MTREQLLEMQIHVERAKAELFDTPEYSRFNLLRRQFEEEVKKFQETEQPVNGNVAANLRMEQ